MLRKTLFWIHLSLGVLIGLIVLFKCVTGVVLVFEDGVNAWADSRHYHYTPPPAGTVALTPEALLAKVKEQKPEATLTGFVIRSDRNRPAEVWIGRTSTAFVDPYTGAVLGEGSPTAKGTRETGTHGFFRTMEDFHRWLSLNGQSHETNETIGSAANVAFLFILITGIFIWFPRKMQWHHFKALLFFKRGARGKARDWNWHNVIGIWSVVPLMLVVLTGVQLSYQWATNLLYTSTGSPLPRPKADKKKKGGKKQEKKSDTGGQAAQQQGGQQVAGTQGSGAPGGGAQGGAAQQPAGKAAAGKAEPQLQARVDAGKGGGQADGDRPRREHKKKKEDSDQQADGQDRPRPQHKDSDSADGKTQEARAQDGKGGPGADGQDRPRRRKKEDGGEQQADARRGDSARGDSGHGDASRNPGGHKQDASTVAAAGAGGNGGNVGNGGRGGRGGGGGRAGGGGRGGGGNEEASGPPDWDGLDKAWVVAQAKIPGWNHIMVEGTSNPVISFEINERTSGQAQRSILRVRRTGEETGFTGYSTASAGEKLRLLSRDVHTGELLGFPTELVMGSAAAGGCVLVYTGLALSLRRLLAWRKRRAHAAAKERDSVSTAA